MSASSNASGTSAARSSDTPPDRGDGRCGLSRWRISDLAEVLAQPSWGDDWVHTRGSVIQRVHAHDLWHAAEVSEILTRNGRAGIDIWR